MDAERAGMDADRSDSCERFRHPGEREHSFEKATRDATMASRVAIIFRMSSVRDSPTLLFWFIRVHPGSFRGHLRFFSFRRSAVPPADLDFSKHTRTSGTKGSAFSVFRKPLY